MSQPEISPGLANVYLCKTHMSQVDGHNGQLRLAGTPVEEVADKLGFHRLLQRYLQTSEDLEPSLRLGRKTAAESLLGCRDSFAKKGCMQALIFALAQGEQAQAALDMPAAYVGALGYYSAAWVALRNQEQLPPAFDEDTDIEALSRILCDKPAPAYVNALEAYLVTVSNHGMNASTFTARVIASTGSELGPALIGALGALKGPLHGGAPGPVLDMLDAIGRAELAPTWIERELSAGRRIMGMGHRVYRVRDPRAAVLEQAFAGLTRGDQSERLQLARAVEETAQAKLAQRYPTRRLRANVEFYTAILLEALQIPREAFTGIFAAGRVAGWAGHYFEQRRDNILIRPKALYVEKAPNAA